MPLPALAAEDLAHAQEPGQDQGGDDQARDNEGRGEDGQGDRERRQPRARPAPRGPRIRTRRADPLALAGLHKRRGMAPRPSWSWPGSG